MMLILALNLQDCAVELLSNSRIAFKTLLQTLTEKLVFMIIF